MTASLVERIESLLAPAAQQRGLELVAVETAGGRHQPIIRVYLDRAGGIDLDAIAEANAWVSETLDREEPVTGPYTLELSSPGVDRPLRKLADFERFVGSTAHIRTKPLDGRSAFTGELVGVDGSDVLLGIDGQTVRIPHAAMRKARLKGNVEFETKGAGDRHEL